MKSFTSTLPPVVTSRRGTSPNSPATNRHELPLSTFKRYLPIVLLFVLAFGATAIVSIPRSLTEATRGDRFWHLFTVHGAWVKYYDSLAAMTKAADVVVVATIDSVAAGRSFGEQRPELDHPDESVIHFATIKLRVDQLLSGEPRTDADGFITLEMLLPERGVLKELEATVPQGKAIYFLRNEGQAAAQQGVSKAIQIRDLDYYRRVNPQGVIRDVDGLVVAPEDGEAAFLTLLNGQRFDQVVEAVSIASVE